MIHTYFVIIAVDLITDTMIKESIGDGKFLRKSLDKTNVILKFNSQYPNSMGGIKKYNHVEILEFLETNSTDWNIGE